MGWTEWVGVGVVVVGYLGLVVAPLLPTPDAGATELSETASRLARQRLTGIDGE